MVNKIHNKVNNELGKQPFTVEEIIEKYSNPPIKTIVTNYCPKNKSNIKWGRAIILMISLILIIYYYKNTRNKLN